VDKLASSLWTSYLSYDVYFVSEDMCLDCACMSKWKQWEMDRVDLSMRTDLKEMMINKPPSHLFTDATLPLHGSWVCLENLSHRTYLTNVETRASVHPMLWLELQLIQFNLLWVFRRFFCFYFASLITLSWLTSKELERAYFHGFWCMVKLLVYEPLLIVR
jgi:hypothetical protein